MNNVYTCLCGAENHWTIFNGKIKCQICGREYNLTDILNMDVCEFNESREDLCMGEPELESKSKGNEMRELNTELLKEIGRHVSRVGEMIGRELPEVVIEEQGRYLAESALVDILHRYYNGAYINWGDLKKQWEVF